MDPGVSGQMNALLMSRLSQSHVGGRKEISKGFNGMIVQVTISLLSVGKRTEAVYIGAGAEPVTQVEQYPLFPIKVRDSLVALQHEDKLQTPMFGTYTVNFLGVRNDRIQQPMMMPGSFGMPTGPIPVTMKPLLRGKITQGVPAVVGRSSSPVNQGVAPKES